MKRTFLLTLLFLAMMPLAVNALTEEIDGIYYNLDSDAKTAEVTRNPNNYGGAIEIPSAITYNEVEYSVTSIGSFAFFMCTGLTSINISNSVTTIDNNAFAYCSALTSIFIPNGVKSIGSEAFSGCKNLSDITISDSVISIGEAAFNETAWYNNQPNGVVYAGRNVYRYKGKMTEHTSVEIKEGTFGITDKAFSLCSNLISITLPNSLINIGSKAFQSCGILEEITIPNSVTNIGDEAFAYCSYLTSLTIGNSVTNIGNGAFYNCPYLNSITLPNSLASIGSKAFFGCSRVTKIIIPNSVTIIGDLAFAGVESLKDMYCYAVKVPETGSGFFNYSGNATLHVPATSIDTYRNAEQWKDFGSIVALTDDDPKPTGVQGINNGVITAEHYYSLDGKHTTTPQRGLNIIRMSNGTTKKIVIK